MVQIIMVETVCVSRSIRIKAPGNWGCFFRSMETKERGKMTKSKECPRCGTYPVYTDGFHRGMGARSRTDNKTQICSDCGVEEAMLDFMHREIVPKSVWPVGKAYD